jgi:hypothetical protein
VFLLLIIFFAYPPSPPRRRDERVRLIDGPRRAIASVVIIFRNSVRRNSWNILPRES